MNFYEELEVVLNAAKEAKEIKIYTFVKDNNHVDVVSEIGDITHCNLEGKNVEGEAFNEMKKLPSSREKTKSIDNAYDFHFEFATHDVNEQSEENPWQLSNRSHKGDRVILTMMIVKQDKGQAEA